MGRATNAGKIGKGSAHQVKYKDEVVISIPLAFRLHKIESKTEI